MRIFLLGVVLLMGGCRGDASTTSSGNPDRAAAASADGTRCEHGVQASVCPKCNPSLAAVFQAKGDWCPEHGFPESFCPICHPELGGRPATAAPAGDAPPDGTRIRLKTAETGRLAGIETVRAAEVRGGARLEVNGIVTYDPTRRAEVNARSAGVIRSLAVDVGARVGAGATLAVVESATVGADRSRLRAAAVRVEVAEATLQRETELHAQGIAAAREVELAREALEIARAEHAAAAAALHVVGRGVGGSGYELTAPIGGTITRRAATIGRMVDTATTLFEIVDTSTMAVDLDIAETDAAIVTPEMEVSLVVDGLPERVFTGAIAYLAPEVDEHTRTLHARVLIENRDGHLKANMFVRAEVHLGAASPTVTVPALAVQRAGDVRLVFVKLGEAEYETRRVKVGRATNLEVEILAGVKAGDEVVTAGSFLLKTETLKSSIGAGCCE